MEEITINIGDHYIVKLKSLGTAGYRWFMTDVNLQFFQVEKILSLESSLAQIPGNNAPERFLITALQSGERIIHFKQSRSFEPDKPPINIYILKVTVK